ncbi:recombinase family protein [Burkholderia gladioli]|uniref:Recombinase family protein n=1 Tax=Burkholderia gladioli TaxID=28095 RepID=A0AAW3FBE2_BURGA|nr:recombinase family protein [Burkholderia gladioli]AJW99907.1 recombinase family protein [Burkholderia gladioli]ASD80930.1 recombinase family protein [Burkholderia gladioli pv. gladioli]AWY53835.1 recombinase family protein [Burkholderia gladioli pv. gladioli]KGC17767.1 recombinase family protein [Burkholderia gladioli]MDC6133090.1 recombinase family protein [Burkholderia gladioli]
MSKPRAYSYLRFSTPEQLKGDSYRRQTTMALEYATRKGLALDQDLTFEDLGVSAFRGTNAEAGRLAEFLEAVRAGLVPRGSYLLVEALDRLSRLSPRKAVRVLEDIVEEGITVVTLNDGREYTSANLDDDPTSLLIAIVLFMRANEESATKSRRLSAAWEGKRQRVEDRPLTAITPAWVSLNEASGKLELVPERAAIVQRIFDMYAAGIGYALIAETFNREGIPCFGRARHWHRTYIRKILVNDAVIGIFTPHRIVHEGGKKIRLPLEKVPGYFPLVISEDLFTKAQSQLNGNAGPAPKHRGAVISNLIAGLARCPICGSTMTRVMKGAGPKSGKPKLVCTKAKAGAGCQYHTVPLDSVETAVISNASYVTGTVPSGRDGLDSDLDAAEVRIEATQDEIENLLRALAVTPSTAIAERIKDLEVSLEALRTERDGLADQLMAANGPLLAKRVEELRQALEAAPLDRAKANAALRVLLSSVTVDYDSGKLLFQWKHGGETEVIYSMPREVR